MDTIPVYNLFRTGGLRTPEDMVLITEYGGWGDLMTRFYASMDLVYIDRRAKVSDVLISRVPIPHLKDIKDLKVRSVGLGAKAFDKLGAATTFITPEEVYSALGSGLIDATDMEDVMGYWSKGFYEVAKYWIWPPLQNAIGATAFVANEDFWDSLPDGYKTLLAIVFRHVADKQNREFSYKALKVLSDVQTMYGVTVTYWDDEDLKLWSETQAEVFDRYPDDPWWSEAWDLLEQYQVDMGYK